MIDLSIIIISFNTLDLTMKCLESVFKYTKGVKFEVIVVDNASTDRSAAEIKRKYRTKVTVIKNSINNGFGAANNQAMNIAQGRYFCLLNSDTVLIGNVFDRMIEWFDQNTFVPIRSSLRLRNHSFSLSSIPSGTVKRLPIGMIGCKLLNPDRSEQHSLGKFPTLLELFKIMFLDKFSRKSMPRKIGEVDYVMGAFMLLKREVFERSGGFDPDIFMYVEELEWCYRVRQQGFSVVYWPEAAIIHYGGQSSVRGRRDQIINIFKGYSFFYRKHCTPYQQKIAFLILKTKAYASILAGKLLNNKNLIVTYKDALQAIK
jgi:GT2 family glycosyltransferase